MSVDMIDEEIGDEGIGRIYLGPRELKTTEFVDDVVGVVTLIEQIYLR